METELLREIISLLKDIKGDGPINLLLTGIIVLIASYIGSYLHRKGQNLATKEDVAEITRNIEGINESDLAVLTHDIEEHSLKSGDVGTVVHTYEDKKGFEVEFVTAEGKTIAVEYTRPCELSIDSFGLELRSFFSFSSTRTIKAW